MHKKLFPSFALLTVVVAMAPVGALAQQKEVPGYVRADLFFDKTTANSIAGLRADPRFPNNPSEVRYVKAWEFPPGGDDGSPPPNDVYNNYGTRLTALLVPKQTAQYVFFIASDDPSELWLSTDNTPANAKLIAREPTWNPVRAWVATTRRNAAAPENRSAPIRLEAGKSYYMETLHSEGGGGDNVAVTWIKQGDPDPTDGDPPIGGEFFVSLVDTQLKIVADPADAVRAPGETAKFSVRHNNLGPGVTMSYQWLKNGASIAGATAMDYVTAKLALADNGAKISVRVSGSGQTATSKEATLTVTAPIALVGFLKFEAYNGITGNPVQNLLDDPKYPDAPDEIQYATAFDSRTVYPNDAHEAYGGRLSGFVIPPESGQYEFFLRSDDASQLFLSTDENPANAAAIAEETGCCGAFEETGAPETSAPVSLVAGRRYYIQALWKEGTGGDFCQVAWRKAGDTTPSSRLTPIPAAFISTTVAAQGNVNISKQPVNATAQENETATFTVTATGTHTPLLIQWQKNGANIPGGVGATYKTPLLAKSDNGAKYRAVVSIPGATTQSDEVTLTVTEDKTPPALLSVKGVPSQTAVVLTFSEKLNPASATTAANYRITTPSGTLSATAAALSSDGTKVTLTTAQQALRTKYTVIVNNVRDTAATPNTIAADTKGVFFAQGKITQDANGFIVWEAESFDRNLDDLWLKDTARGTPSGGVSMVNPNGAGGSENATKLEYDIEFKRTGNHILWYRASGNDGGDDSGWFHFEGERPPNRTTGNQASMTGFSGQLDFVWRSQPQDGGGRYTFDVPTAGVHTVALARREDGSFFDKFIITTNPSYTPTGFGPDETREGAPAPPTVTIAGLSEGQKFSSGATVAISATASGSSDLAIVRVDFSANGTKIGEATASPFSFNWSNVKDGVYAITATATDEIGLTATSPAVKISVGTPPPQALLVVGGIPLNASDAGVKARLESQGWQVESVIANASQTSGADGKQLIITSSTVPSGDVGNKFRDVAVPVINWEGALQDNFLMTLDQDTVTRGGTAGTTETQVSIVKADHPLAAGFPAGLKAVSSGADYSWGVPGPGATIVATVAATANQAVIYGYDTGATLIDGTTKAPARRVHFLMTDNTFAALNADGLKLFDAAVAWAANIAVTPPSGAPTLSFARTAAGLTVTFTGTLQSADSVTGPWTDVASAASPMSVPASGSQKFYRAKQ